jgi:vacuolar protein sorting-associated protein 3
LLDAIQDESTSKLWRAKASSFASASANSGSFLSYFASTTPNSDHKRVRLKTALFLQASTFYDAQNVKELLLPHQKVLCFEIALLDGKVGFVYLFFRQII